MYKILLVFVAFLLFSCNSQKKYSDFDISYSRSGGFAPVYENFLIKGNNVFYSLEENGKKSEKSFTISEEELKDIHDVLSENNFRFIQEDHKKVYDRISTSIVVKTGPNSGSKSDASFIRSSDSAKWENILDTFRKIIDSKVNPSQH